MKFTTFLLTTLFCCNMFASCEQKREKPLRAIPISIIYDTDMGNDIDDALALDMLYKYQEDGLIDILAITSNKKEEGSTEYIDIMNNYYGFENIPIGKIVDGIDSKVGDHFATVISKDKTYKRSIVDYDALPQSVALLRKTLQMQKDSSVVIVAVGFSTNMSELLNSMPDEYSPLSGKDLIAQKVKCLCMMAGEFRSLEYDAEYNVRLDVESAKGVFANWPTKIITSPFDVGLDVLYPGSSIVNDFAYAPNHPLVKGYEAFRTMPYDRPTWDLTAVLYAVEGDMNGKYFSLSEKGIIEVDEIGRTTHTKSEKGNRYYLKANQQQKQALTDRFLELITRKSNSLK